MWTDYGLAGLVAAEGTFTVTRTTKLDTNGLPRLRFVFQLAMASRDRFLLERLRDRLGFGSIIDRPRREAHFSASGDRFAFVVALGATDVAMCHLFRDFVGVGTVRIHPRRREHYDDEAVFRVQRLRDLVEVVVPFMDAHLPPSHKRQQYETWRASLLEYWATRAKRRRSCSVNGCGEPNRARGLCRRHYYETYRS